MLFYHSFSKVLVVVCLCFLNSSVLAQDQNIADSLTKIYQADTLDGIDKLELLRSLSHNEMDFNKALKWAEELIALSKPEDNYLYLGRGYNLKGNAHLSLGNYENASAAYINYLKAAKKIKNKLHEGMAYMAIANVYSQQDGTFDKEAEENYEDAIQILRKVNDSVYLGEAIYNAGDHYLKNERYDLALEHLEEAQVIFEKTIDSSSMAYVMGNIGKIYTEQGKPIQAEKNIDQAIAILEKLEDYSPITEFLNYKSEIYIQKQEWDKAEEFAQNSLKLALSHDLKQQVSDAYLQLSKLYKLKGDLALYDKYYNDHILTKESITNDIIIKNLLNQQNEYEVSLLKELDKRQKTIIYISILAFVLIFFLALSMFRRYKFVKETNRIIEQEKNKSDNLLLNILPKETAQELKHSGKVQAQKFDSITVLFTDFKGFTNYAEHLSPEKLVESVDYYFSKFDEVMEKYNLEKIKTVGDSYMCAGGLHYHQNDHALKMVEAACEISEFVKNCKKSNSSHITCFDMRIGINTGPVVAGVVGTRKFAYDIWGDTVNIASRMESNSEIGKINISENTYELIKDEFNCEYRGEISVKNKGMMKMYFVIGKNEDQQPYPIKEIITTA